MFDLGMQELIVIFIVALLVFGPKRLPELGRTIGRGLAELRRAMQDVRTQIDTETELGERHKPLETGPEASHRPVESDIAGDLPEGLVDRGELEEKEDEGGAETSGLDKERKEDAGK